MKINVMVGGLYKDEGKGKAVSKLWNNYDYIFRVNTSSYIEIGRKDKDLIKL